MRDLKVTPGMHRYPERHPMLPALAPRPQYLPVQDRIAGHDNTAEAPLDIRSATGPTATTAPAPPSPYGSFGQTRP